MPRFNPSGKKQRLSSEWSRFLTIIGCIFVLWTGYRLIGGFPEWVEEVFLKGLIFGTPVIWELNRRAIKHAEFGLGNQRFWLGMYLGLGLGALYLTAAYASNVLRGVVMQPVQLYLAERFWNIFVISIFTSWWETLLFWGYGWTTLNHLFSKISPEDAGFNATIWSSIVFIIFHLPLIFITQGFGKVSAFAVVAISLFAFGQAIVYWKTRNLYTLTISHLLWGMMLLVYS